MADKSIIYDRLKVFLICGLLATITFSKLNLNSICIILLLGVWLIEGKFISKGRRLLSNPVFIFFALFTLLHFISIVYSPSLAAGWKNAETKAGFLVIPLIICSRGVLKKERRLIMLCFSICISVAAIYCVLRALFYYMNTADAEVFFYHSLVAPIKHHAVYFSVYTFICLLFLVLEIYNSGWNYSKKILFSIWLIFLFSFIILLSSKMVLVILLGFLASLLIYRLFRQKKTKQALMLLIVPAAILFGLIAFDNPVKSRFTNLLDGNVSVLTQEKFHPADYFNGFQFRVLLWRVTYLILRDEDAWLIGVSPSAAQDQLRNKYKELNLYAGDQKTNSGYFDYNCHNQFLQTTLQLGLIGLAVLLCLITAFFYKAYRVNNATLFGILTIIIAFCFTESILERQYGLILFALIPLLYLEEETTSESNQEKSFLRVEKFER